METVMNKTNSILIEKKDSGYIGENLREHDELWCQHCYDVFPVHQLKIDFFGNLQGCGSANHPKCDGAGFGVDIFKANCEYAIGCRQDAQEEKAHRASMTEEEKRAEHIKWYFIGNYRDKKNNFLNQYNQDWSSTKVFKHVKRFNECEDFQASKERIEARIERIQCLNPSDIIIQGDAKQIDTIDKHLGKLLSRQSYRDSFHFVMFHLLDQDKLEEYNRNYTKKGSGWSLMPDRVRNLFLLVERVSCAEDAYKISRRAPGSAFSGKKRK
jgi:hypothetical protein